jgi:ABC-2 type transport system ATP-binding protein
MNEAIQIEGVSKTFRKGWQRQAVEAVRDVSLSVAPGEAFGFIGPNGAGKSTTIRILMGLTSADSGKAMLFGVDAGLPQARKGVAYVPESTYLYDYLTPLEILQMSLRLHGVQPDKPKAHCMEWLERLSLRQSASSQIRSFSKGMTQRVAIAQAMCIQARLLVLDEPLSGLDPVGRHDVVEILAEYKRSGGTLFFTSHVLHDVERLADRFGLIHQGQLRSVRSPSELVGMEEVCVIRTSGSTPVQGMTEGAPGSWVGQVQRKELWQMLEALRSASHVVIEIRPTLSLEQAFLQVVKQ